MITFFTDLTWFFRIDISIYVAFLLVMLLLISSMKLDKRDLLNRRFFFLVAIVSALILIEAITCIFTAFPQPWQVPISMILHVVLFSAAPILTAIWIYSMWRMIDICERKRRWQTWVLFLPAAINAVFAFASIWTKWYFYFNAQSIYQRGSINLIAPILLAGYLFVALIYIFSNRARLDRQEYNLLLIATFIPFIGLIVQSLFYGILIAWPSIGISFIFIYLFLEQRLVAIDRLTGAWSRDSFDFKISKRISCDQSQPFGAIYFDLDHLKQINDQYGHQEGDAALKNTVACVKRVLEADQIIARLGGDEFIVVLYNPTPDKLRDLKTKIRQSLDEYNHSTMKPYRLNISIGVDIYRHQYATMEEFINHIDELMYVEKKQRKQLNIDDN